MQFDRDGTNFFHRAPTGVESDRSRGDADSKPLGASVLMEMPHDIYASLFGFGTTQPDGILGGSVSSQGLQSAQGIPGGPEVQALSLRHGRSGWALHTHRQLSHQLQNVMSTSASTKNPKLSGGSGAWGLYR
jgi:hypothetical protein